MYGGTDGSPRRGREGARGQVAIAGFWAQVLEETTVALAQATRSPGAGAAVSALHPQLGCRAEQGPWSQSQSVSFYSLTGSSGESAPTPILPQHSLSLFHYGQSLRTEAACLPPTQLTWGASEKRSCAGPSWASSCSKVRGTCHCPSAAPLLRPAVLGACLSFRTHTTQALHPGLRSPGGKFQSLFVKGTTWLGSWSFPGSGKIEVWLDSFVGHFPG